LIAKPACGSQWLSDWCKYACTYAALSVPEISTVHAMRGLLLAAATAQQCLRQASNAVCVVLAHCWHFSIPEDW
jgi:hypothetical protein